MLRIQLIPFMRNDYWRVERNDGVAYAEQRLHQGDAGWKVGFEGEDGWGQGEAAVVADLEDLDYAVVSACNHQEIALWSDHEIARMTGCAGVAGLFEGAVGTDREDGDAVVVETV